MSDWELLDFTFKAYKNKLLFRLDFVDKYYFGSIAVKDVNKEFIHMNLSKISFMPEDNKDQAYILCRFTDKTAKVRLTNYSINVINKNIIHSYVLIRKKNIRSSLSKLTFDKKYCELEIVLHEKIDNKFTLANDINYISSDGQINRDRLAITLVDSRDVKFKINNKHTTMWIMGGETSLSAQFLDIKNNNEFLVTIKLLKIR